MCDEKCYESDWTPVRRGNRFCSPSCGRGCTVEEHELAQLRAERLCARLNRMPGGFKDWEPHIWENLGWHYRARRNVAQPNETLYTRNECDLHEYLNADGSPRRYWVSVLINGRQFHNEAETAEDALLITMTEIRQFQQAFETSFAKFQALP